MCVSVCVCACMCLRAIKEEEEILEIKVVKCTVLPLTSLSQPITEAISHPEERRGEGEGKEGSGQLKRQRGGKGEDRAMRRKKDKEQKIK